MPLNLTFTLKALMSIALVFATVGTAQAASDTCPSTQSPYAPGCSTCTECCIFQFGMSNCEDSLQWYGIARDPACNTLWIGMDHAWISECTGAFTNCQLFNSTDCSGDDFVQIDNTANLCHAPGFYIKSFWCLF